VLASGGRHKRVWIESDGTVLERLEVVKASAGWNRAGGSRLKGQGFSRSRPR
jgi:hypothetical protein